MTVTETTGTDMSTITAPAEPTITPSGHTVGLAGHYYNDPDIFAAEMDLVFAHSWHFIGHVSQVSEKGQVIMATVGNDQVIVTHDGTQRHAFYNVCQHRGHQLLFDDSPHNTCLNLAATPTSNGTAPCNDTAEPSKLNALTCPYHAWVWGLDGKLIRARGEDVGEMTIPTVRCEEMAGFLWVNLDLNAAPLASVATGVEAQILAAAPDSHNRFLAHRRTHRIDANWKIAVENYNECYHCPNVHKAFTKSVVDAASYRIHCDDDVIRHQSESAAAQAGDYVGPYGGDVANYVAFYVWPSSAIQCYPGGELNTFRWVPLNPHQTLLIREWWLDTPSPNSVQSDKITLDWDTTVAEDFSIMESVHKGVASRGYVPGPLITDPNGVGNVHTEDTVPHLQSLFRRDLSS